MQFSATALIHAKVPYFLLKIAFAIPVQISPQKNAFVFLQKKIFFNLLISWKGLRDAQKFIEVTLKTTAIAWLNYVMHLNVNNFVWNLLIFTYYIEELKRLRLLSTSQKPSPDGGEQSTPRYMWIGLTELKA